MGWEWYLLKGLVMLGPGRGAVHNLSVRWISHNLVQWFTPENMNQLLTFFLLQLKAAESWSIPSSPKNQKLSHTHTHLWLIYGHCFVYMLRKDGNVQKAFRFKLFNLWLQHYSFLWVAPWCKTSVQEAEIKKVSTKSREILGTQEKSNTRVSDVLGFLTH